jgi:pyruvate dehydrogenase E2 component (dihydrolipoamide acetyltransferase)
MTHPGVSEQVFRLPDLGEGLTEAEIVEWQVAEGDEVAVDQHVVVVETAKATVEVPCPYAGTVHTLHGAVGDVVEVGKPLISVAGATAGTAEPSAASPPREELAGTGQYREEEQAGSGAVLVGYGTAEAPRRRRRSRRQSAVGESGAPVGRSVGPATEPEARVPANAGPAPAANARSAPAATSGSAATQTGAVRVISPIVRKLARDHGVELAALVDTAPGGIVRRFQVEEAVRASATAAGPSATEGDERVPLRGIRKVIADKLTTSRREIPDATTWVDVDATGLMDTKDALRALRPEAGIGVLALVARITVAGLRRYPDLNASVDVEREEIVRHGRIHLGFAAQSPRGLVVPVVHDAHELSTSQLAAALRELTDRAREGSLSPAELSGGTFTLNNYGVFGVDGSTPIINHPEAAMLGIGRIVDKPWAHQGQLALRKVTQLSFTFDHRVCDGGVAGGFLRYVADCVEAPATLLAEL